MLRKVISISIIILITAACKLSAQSTYTYGNLLRIRFDQKEVVLNDTAGSWFHIKTPGYYGFNTSYLKYYEHFTMNGKDYFLKKRYATDDRPIFGYSGGARFLESEKYPEGMPFGKTIDSYWDFLTPFMIDRSIVVETINGSWLISGDFLNAYLYKNDSLLVSPAILPGKSFLCPLKSVVGKVGNKYLWFGNPYGYNGYYLSDLSDSPYIDTSKTVKFSFTNSSISINNTIISVKNIKDDLYAAARYKGQGVDIYSLVGNKFYFVKNSITKEFMNSYLYQPLWECRNGFLYQINNCMLERYSFNYADSSFGSQKVLLDSLNLIDFDMSGNYGIDKSYKYLARIFRSANAGSPDILKIYDMEKAEFISTVILNGINGANTPIIDSPYVYIHQITRQYTITSVEESKDISLINFSFTAFPNPFNPVATIIYSIPLQSHIELKVYDMLGREVATLVNKEKTAGEYKVQFDGSSLPSGVYIYTLQAGSYRDSKKLLLLK